MSLDQIFRDFYSSNPKKKKPVTSANKKIVILNSEGTILQAEKKGDEYFFNFKDDKHVMNISKANIRKFLKGELLISIPSGKIFDIDNYTSCICFTEEDMLKFLE